MIEVSKHTACVFESASAGLMSVKSKDLLSKATSLMRINNFSQIAVLDTAHQLKGIVSWKTIGSSFVDIDENSLVEDFMSKKIKTASLNTSIFEILNEINNNEEDFIFIKDEFNKWCGIVTSHDIVKKYSNLIKPLMFLESIEKRLRKIISETMEIKIDEVNEILKKDYSTFDDFVFSDYQQIINSNSKYKRQNKLDNSVFNSKLQEINEIRNKFMHFRVEGLNDFEIRNLEVFSNLLDDNYLFED